MQSSTPESPLETSPKNIQSYPRQVIDLEKVVFVYKGTSLEGEFLARILGLAPLLSGEEK